MMQLSKTGLSKLTLTVAAVPLVFTGFMQTPPQAAVSHQESARESELNDGSEEETRLVEKRVEDLVRKIEEEVQGAGWDKGIRAMEEEIRKIERDIERRFESPQFQASMREIEEIGQRVEEHFQTEEWRQFEARMKTLGQEISKPFQSKEWEEAMTRLREETQRLNQELQEHYWDSSEWKLQQQEIKGLSKTIQDTFGEEWQRRIKEMESELREILKELPHGPN